MGETERTRLQRIRDGEKLPDQPAPPEETGTSRYARRSAHLPHLGEEADHDVIDDMDTLRGAARDRKRRGE